MVTAGKLGRNGSHGFIRPPWSLLRISRWRSSVDGSWVIGLAVEGTKCFIHWFVRKAPGYQLFEINILIRKYAFDKITLVERIARRISSLQFLHSFYREFNLIVTVPQSSQLNGWLGTKWTAKSKDPTPYRCAFLAGVLPWLTWARHGVTIFTTAMYVMISCIRLLVFAYQLLYEPTVVGVSFIHC